MHEKDYIKKCLAEIERTLHWASREKWVYEDFKQLQDLIFDSSSIQLSVHTLERLFGKLKTQDNYNPQIETKNALAIFLGYKSWSHYKSENKIIISEGPPNGVAVEYKAITTDPKETARISPYRAVNLLERFLRPLKKRLYKQVLIAIGCCGCLALVYFFRTPTSPTSPAIDFKVTNPYGRVPHTAKFSYDRPNPKLTSATSSK